MVEETFLNKKIMDDVIRKVGVIGFIRDYIKENDITCPDDIHQSDKLNLDAPNFMEKCCEIVGYKEEKDDD